MKEIWFIFFGALFLSLPVKAQENPETADVSAVENDEAETPNDVFEGIRYGVHTNEAIEIKELPAQEDDLYDGTEVRPIEKGLSEEEQMQEGSTDLEVISDTETELPNLSCDDPKLKEQVKTFIYNNLSKVATNSVIEKRSRVLLTKSLQEFKDVTNEEIDGSKNFAAASAVAYLRINSEHKISRICRSSGNDSKQFNDLYIIIYPYIRYYKVVVTNLMSSTEQMGDATFVYNW